MELKVTKVFDEIDRVYKDKRFIILQGGSRSSKTYSIIQTFILYCTLNPNTIVSIIRKTFPALRASVLRDFIEILQDLGIYSEKQHNRTENIYTFSNGSYIEFFSADNEQKLRGRKRDICWINESNELNFEEFTQLNMRTSEKMFFDFNPSENFHWIYDLLQRPESVLIHSTYKDNPFLPESQVKEIENLINYDESYYRIYALGEKGTGKSTIYTHWKYYDELPEIKDTYYGLDFGYNDPTVLIEVNIIDNKAYCKELLYESFLTSTDLIKKLEYLNTPKNKEIICDTARPEMIEDLRRRGWKAKGAIKDVKAGIDSVKSTELFIHKESLNMIKEIRGYKWKSNGDKLLEEPVGIWDHTCDSLRYAIHWWKTKTKTYSRDNFKIY